MQLTGHEVLKFDSFLPIYNWIYPLAGKPSGRYAGSNAVGVFDEIAKSRSRALYFHVPFCETICSFCPFVRGKFRDSSLIDVYVDALLREIELKSKYRGLTDSPVGAIFFGGGTPSLLSPRHVQRIGEALSSCFDLSMLREFSFEFEVKSVNADLIESLLDIGVTHARFGLQTLSPKYRELFSLTATENQVRSAAHLLGSAFPHVSCDLLYGMNGQSEEELFDDLQGVLELGVPNIDCYPINNLMTQPRLHRAFREIGAAPTSGLTKFYMNLLVREVMREGGYLPHNGHGYVRCDAGEVARDPVVTDTYSFVYHEHVLGYPGFDLLGFGTNAVSSFDKFVVFNPSGREQYVRQMMDGQLSVRVNEHGSEIDACRPLALALPYHGSADREDIDWRRVPELIQLRLAELERHGLVESGKNTISLTRLGWEWYTSVMYYLQPIEEQRAIREIVRTGLRDSRRDIEPLIIDPVLTVP